MKAKKPAADTSPKVPQRDKVKYEFEIKPVDLKPKQQEFMQVATAKNTQLVFASGPAGSSKTFLATLAALQMLQAARISDILYIRAAVESSKNKLGFLPGDVDEKMAYYGIPLLDKLEELLHKQTVASLIKDERITVMPVNFIRGQSWNAKCIIVDEAQNLTEEEIYTIATRIGKFSKCFILADPTQSDIARRDAGGFETLRDLYCTPLGESHGILSRSFDTSDIMRSELCRFLVEERQKLRATLPA